MVYFSHCKNCHVNKAEFYTKSTESQGIVDRLIPNNVYWLVQNIINVNHNCERFLYEEYITLNDLNEENASNFLGIKHLNRKIKKKMLKQMQD